VHIRICALLHALVLITYTHFLHHTHTQAHARTHARTHACTHTPAGSSRSRPRSRPSPPPAGGPSERAATTPATSFRRRRRRRRAGPGGPRSGGGCDVTESPEHLHAGPGPGTPTCRARRIGGRGGWGEGGMKYGACPSGPQAASRPRFPTEKLDPPGHYCVRISEDSEGVWPPAFLKWKIRREVEAVGT
jgi:hypothetical protein